MPVERRLPLTLFLSTLLFLSVTAVSAAQAGSESGDRFTDREIQPVIGSTGGIHILAEPGELVVEIEKRDLNRTGNDRELRAILIAPDREVLDEVRLDDDGLDTGSGLGPARSATLSAQVEAAGVYSVNVTVSGGQMETDVVWGFRTNQDKYLVESARGHRDAAHEEPILLRNPQESSEVWFQPRSEPFLIRMEDLPATLGELTLRNRYGETIRSLPVKDGEVSIQIDPGDEPRNTPWGIHFPESQATLYIDGVTRWDPDLDIHRHLSHWSPAPDAWFPHRDYRWLLAPYHKRLFGSAGESGSQRFLVRNLSDREQTIDLSLEGDVDPSRVRLNTERLSLAGEDSAEVHLHFTWPEEVDSEKIRIRATPSGESGYTTWASVELNRGDPPARERFNPPFVATPYAHENRQLGYLPDYPTDWELYVDLENRPMVRTDEGVRILRNGEWKTTVFAESVRSDDPHFDRQSFDLGRSNTKIAVDDENDLYIIAGRDGRAALLHSTDGGRTFQAYGLGESGGWDIEDFTGHNIPHGPPAILRSVQTYVDEEHFWRRISTLELILAGKTDDGGLDLQDPIPVTEMSLGVGSHSGIPSAIASTGDKIHIIWGEATDPEKDVPGVPTYVQTYNRVTGEFEGEPVLIGHGPPANNVHNRPSLTVDGDGRLHAMIGTHGEPFLYARSLGVNTAHSGWSEPITTAGEEIRQTYVGLVADRDNTLHLVYRKWRYREDPHPLSHHAALAYQRKQPGEPWSEPKLLFISPFSEYSIFYHRLGVDMEGRLMLSYDYWSTWWFYRNDFRDRYGNFRTTMISEDGGDSWRFLYSDDFEPDTR